jgi:hypothetical protein
MIPALPTFSNLMNLLDGMGRLKARAILDNILPS